jgi:hypothetical protein
MQGSDTHSLFPSALSEILSVQIIYRSRHEMLGWMTNRQGDRKTIKEMAYKHFKAAALLQLLWR